MIIRRGFSLAELLAVLLVLAVVLVGLTGVFATIITDIPRSYRVIQSNTTLLDMLEQLREDVSAARELPVSTDSSHLLIGLEDGMISYQVEEDRVLRCSLAPDDGGAKDTRVWSVPHAKVEWQVWREDDKGYAVQVRTHIEHKVRGHWERKMANSHLYFVGAFAEALR